MTTKPRKNTQPIKTGTGKTGSTKKPKPTKQPVVVDVQITVLPPSHQKRVHPAMHFDVPKKRMFFGFQLPVEIDSMDGNPPKRKIVNCLISDKGETIPCIKQELERHSIILTSNPLIDIKHGNRMSDIILEEWTRTGGKKPRPWPLTDYLEFLVSCLKEMIDFSNEDSFYYLALWIFGTYCHRLFESYPYDFYNGPTGTGKTRTLEVKEATTFNGILSPNMSPSALFRTVESRAPTLLMDETEKLYSTDASQEIRQLVNSGYKKGAAVLRTEKTGDDGFQTQTFGTYCPKAFANIAGLDDVLQNRCVTTMMTRSKNVDVMNARLMTKDRKDKWQDIRNQSYLLVYEYWNRIAALIEDHADTEVVEGVIGRPLELWSPIFVLSELFEDEGCTNLYDRMKRLAIKMVEEMMENFKDSQSGQMLRALRNMMAENPSHEEGAFASKYYRYQDLIPKITLQATFAEEGVDFSEEGIASTTVKVKRPRWLKPAYVNRQLRLLGFDDYKGAGSGRSVYLTRAKLVDLWERYMGDWEEPEKPFDPQERLDDSGQSPKEDSEEGESARAKPPLSEDVIIMLLEERTNGCTHVGLREKVVELGYSREEFEEVFKEMKKKQSIIQSGKTPFYYRHKKREK